MKITEIITATLVLTCVVNLFCSVYDYAIKIDYNKNIIIVTDVDKIEKNNEILYINGILSADDLSHRNISTYTFSDYIKKSLVRSDDDYIILFCPEKGSYKKLILAEKVKAEKIASQIEGLRIAYSIMLLMSWVLCIINFNIKYHYGE